MLTLALQQPIGWVNMPVVFRTGSMRIVVFANDHGPPHVHAVTPDGSAKVWLGASPAEVTITAARGLKESQGRAIIRAVMARHATCVEAWRRRHGD